MRVEVGDEAQVFYIHESIICDASPVIKAALMGSYLEGYEKKMSLPDDEGDIVDRVVMWLYTRGSIKLEGDMPSQLWLVAKLSIFADKYHIIKLKNQLIDELYSLYDRGATLVALKDDFFGFFYRHVPKSSKIRQLLSRWAVIDIPWSVLSSDGFHSMLREQPEFAADLTVAFALNLQNPSTQNPFEISKLWHYEKS